MIRNVLLTTIMLLSIVCLHAQNLITAGDNGTFESLNSDQTFINFNRPVGVNSIGVIRSNEASYEGNYSLKVWIDNPKPFDKYMFLQIPLIEGGNHQRDLYVGKTYIVKCRIYVPSSVNPAPLTNNSNINNNGLEYLSASSDIGITCKFNWFEPILKDSWFESYQIFVVDVHAMSTAFHIQPYYTSDTKPICFYVDNIELFEFSEIKDNAIIDGGSITLNPSGGLPADFGSYNLPYRYYWNDGVTTKDRINVSGEKKVTIYQDGPDGRPQCNPKTFTYYIDPCEVNPPNPQLTLSSSLFFKGRPLTITAINHQSGYNYSYKFYYGNGGDQISEQVTSSGNQVSYTFHDLGVGYPAVGTHAIDVNVSAANGCSEIFSFIVEVKDIAPLCEIIIPSSTGEFKLDKFSGLYVFQRSANCSVDISLGCIEGKVDAPLYKNAVAASATAYSDRWSYDYLPVQQGNGSAVEKAEIGKWRPKAVYAYNKGTVTADKNNNSGRFTLSHFNWQHPEVNTKTGWLKVSEVTKYSPHGDAVEELNALNVPSTAKFGYRNTLPYLIAQNSDYNSVLFESFENVYGTSLEDGVTVNGGTRDPAVSHSGGYSLKLLGQFVSRSFSRSIQFEQKGMLVRLWAKGNDLTNAISLIVTTPSQTLQQSFKQIARSGAWSLWEARLEPNSFALSDGQNFQVSINKLINGDVWIDDVRIQPLDAELSCYVYDVRSLRLLAVLDDQHFAMFYQYNTEGKLVRKMIETERGIKTVQETQYNTPQVSK